jgi:death-on-curing protein
MMEPGWISLEAAQILHDLQIDEFGGSHGIRDIGLLDSALGRPLNLFAYEEEATLARLAASYCTPSSTETNA